MRSTPRRPWIPGAVFAVTALAAVPVHALTFGSSCDLFEVDGNEFGSADGVFDYVDDFDNGTLAPDWTVLLGTAIESGGVVTVKNPGATIPLGSGVLEISTIENELHGIHDGEGDFTMISDWGVTLPPIDSELHMQLYSISPIIEAAGLTINNDSPELAAQPPGAIPGYSVSQSVTQGFGDGFTVLQQNAVPISAASVTGHIILRMQFDDATNMLTCSFSLDDGQTFQSPFPSMHIFNGGVNDYDVLLGAAGITPPPPPPTPFLVPMKSFEAKNPSTPAARKVRYTAKALNLFAPDFGYLAGTGAGLAVKLDAVTQCFFLPPGPSWSAKSAGNGYTYRDANGAHGPVKVMSLRRASNGTFQTKAVILGRNGTLNVVPPNPGTRGDVRLSLGTGDEYCASTAGGAVVKNDAKSFKAKNAPAPATCGITSCTGAFLN